MDKPETVAAAGHKLARLSLIYTLRTKGDEYTGQGEDYYEERYRQHLLHNLNQRANQLGMKLISAEAT